MLENESLVNWPNWLPLSFRPEGGNWFDLDDVDLLEFKFRLNLYRGLLEREVRFRDSDEREFALVCRRLVHMANPHLAAIEWRITSLNWSGQLEIRSSLDGTVTNQNVERYRQLNGKHLNILETGYEGEDAVVLSVQTNQSCIRMTQAARTRVYENDVLVPTQRHSEESEGRIGHRLVVPLPSASGTPYRKKIVTVYTSRDFAISNPNLAARKLVRRAGTFDELCQSHQRCWQHLWSITDIVLQDGEAATQLVLRLHLFHLLQTVSPNSIDRDIGVPSRGWHGGSPTGAIFCGMSCSFFP